MDLVLSVTGVFFFFRGNQLIYLLPFPTCAMELLYICVIKTVLKCSATLLFRTEIPVIKGLTSEIHGASEMCCFICSSGSSLGILV